MVAIDTSLWYETLEAEINSAGNLLDVDRFRQLSDMYAGLGMDDVAVKVMNRLLRFKAGRKELMPALLDTLTKQKSLSMLNSVVSVMLKDKQRAPALRRQMARALSVLGQTSLAAAEWCSLINEDSLDQPDWAELARFVFEHGNVNDLGVRTESAVKTCHDPVSSSLAQYCALRCKIDENRTVARTILKEIDARDIPEPDIAFDLAICAFRLCDLKLAETAARHALNLNPDLKAVNHALKTFVSFATEQEHTFRCVGMAAGVIDVVAVLGITAVANTVTWGLLRKEHDGSVVACEIPFPKNRDERYLDVRDDAHDTIATFSVLPHDSSNRRRKTSSYSDPFEVLPYVDWGVPHLMVQRRGKQHRLHTFVGTNCRGPWSFEEVEIVGEAHVESEQHVPAGTVLWEAAFDELENRYDDEENF